MEATLEGEEGREEGRHAYKPSLEVQARLQGGTRLLLLLHWSVDHCQKEGIFRRRRPFLFTRWNDEVRDSFVPLLAREGEEDT